MIILFSLTSTVLIASFFAQNKTNGLEITWIGHSCFEIQYFDQRILIDPFTPELFDYARPEGKYTFVFASHKAKDHYYFDGIDADLYLLASGEKNVLFTEDCSGKQQLEGKTVKNIGRGSFTFWTVPSYHDDQKGAAEGVNGILCFDFDGIKVVHLGDLGHILDEDHLKKIGSVDVLMIPIDGYFTIDINTAKKIIEQLDPKIVFPMHYKTDRSKQTQPIYTAKDIISGFKKAKKLHQSRLIIDNKILNQRQQIILLEYLHK
jgi:L-ascorbate metabolism protein UlaG (beta-lactamase superfamily)